MIILETKRIERGRIIDRIDIVNRIAVAFKRSMRIVQVSCDFCNAETIGGWQPCRR